MTPNRAQLEGLVLLAERPRETTRSTHHGYLSGAVASALERRGWATWSRGTVSITEAGREVLRETLARNSSSSSGVAS